jgi:hypothetical protein
MTLGGGIVRYGGEMGGWRLGMTLTGGPHQLEREKEEGGGSLAAWWVDLHHEMKLVCTELIWAGRKQKEADLFGLRERKKERFRVVLGTFHDFENHTSTKNHANENGISKYRIMGPSLAISLSHIVGNYWPSDLILTVEMEACGQRIWHLLDPSHIIRRSFLPRHLPLSSLCFQVLTPSLADCCHLLHDGAPRTHG